MKYCLLLSFRKILFAKLFPTWGTEMPLAVRKWPGGRVFETPALENIQTIKCLLSYNAPLCIQ